MADWRQSQTAAAWAQQAVEHSAPEDRYRALLALAEVGPVTLVDLADRILSDTDAMVRAGAAKLLGKATAARDQLPSEKITPLSLALKSRLTDADPDVRFEAARAAILWDDDAVVDAAPVLWSLLAEPEPHPLMVAAIIETLTRHTTLGPELVPRLIPLLDDPQPEVREAATAALAHAGPAAAQAVPWLVLLLDDEEPLVRERAAQALGQIAEPTPQIRDALTTATTDEDPLVAAAATTALANLSRR